MYFLLFVVLSDVIYVSLSCGFVSLGQYRVVMLEITSVPTLREKILTEKQRMKMNSDDLYMLYTHLFLFRTKYISLHLGYISSPQLRFVLR